MRTVTVEDAERAGTVHFTCWVETYAALASQEFWERVSAERSVATWRRLLTEGLDARLAEVDGEVVGVAVATDGGERSGHPPVRDRELGNLYVLRAHHGTGAGQALLDAVLPPGTPAQLWAARDNPRALRFYERNGFVPDGAADDGSAFGGIASVRLVR